MPSRGWATLCATQMPSIFARRCANFGSIQKGRETILSSREEPLWVDSGRSVVAKLECRQGWGGRHWLKLLNDAVVLATDVHQAEQGHSLVVLGEAHGAHLNVILER